jgi:N utilization substance protein A
MGSRVRNVMTELHGEKIDIVDYAEDPAQFVANALSPARVSRVHVMDAAARIARVIVPDFQLSLAIGKEGQNARLAAKLTGWKIDIRSDTETDAPEPAPQASGSGAHAPDSAAAVPDSQAAAPGSGPQTSVGATGGSAGAADSPAR